MSESSLVIKRGGGYADSLRSYRVLVDGEEVGQVKRNDALMGPIAPGKHSVQVRIDWTGSKEIEFDAAPGETVTFECHSTPAWKVFFRMFGRTTWIDLVRTA